MCVCYSENSSQAVSLFNKAGLLDVLVLCLERHEQKVELALSAGKTLQKHHMLCHSAISQVTLPSMLFGCNPHTCCAEFNIMENIVYKKMYTDVLLQKHFCPPLSTKSQSSPANNVLFVGLCTRVCVCVCVCVCLSSIL